MSRKKNQNQNFNQNHFTTILFNVELGWRFPDSPFEIFIDLNTPSHIYGGTIDYHYDNMFNKEFPTTYLDFQYIISFGCKYHFFN